MARSERVHNWRTGSDHGKFEVNVLPRYWYRQRGWCCDGASNARDWTMDGVGKLMGIPIEADNHLRNAG